MPHRRILPRRELEKIVIIILYSLLIAKEDFSSNNTIRRVFSKFWHGLTLIMLLQLFRISNVFNDVSAIFRPERIESNSMFLLFISSDEAEELLGDLNEQISIWKQSQVSHIRIRSIICAVGMYTAKWIKFFRSILSRTAVIDK